MIYDFREYTLMPGKTNEYMAAVREVALGIREKYGVKLAGWYYSDVGELNKVVHIWAFRDHAHMKEAKAQVAADPDWTGKYIPRSGRPDPVPKDLPDAIPRLRAGPGVESRAGRASEPRGRRPATVASHCLL